MNRLILIGNGFDLAHGMKTSYNDFIIWYLKYAYRKCLIEEGYQDQLIGIRHTFPDFYLNAQRTEERIDQRFQESKLYLLGTSQGFEYGQNDSFFQVDFCSNLLMNLLNRCTDANWVDVENEFYKELKAILNTKTVDATRLKSLNDSLEDLINHLHRYLQELDVPPYITEYQDIFSSPVKITDFPTGEERLIDNHPKETMVLNFNYTDTIEQYHRHLRSLKYDINFTVNYIHGKLGESRNPLVFGFGDELDSAYKAMEQQEQNGFFHHIKSFWYSKTLNYRKLLNFLNAGEYQIFILGQSCGLSDRTLLSMLLGNEKCKSVKVFYYGDAKHNNFTDILHQLGRQFGDKFAMRDKIVPFPLCERMPQHND